MKLLILEGLIYWKIEIKTIDRKGLIFLLKRFNFFTCLIILWDIEFDWLIPRRRKLAYMETLMLKI